MIKFVKILNNCAALEEIRKELNIVMTKYEKDIKELK